MLILNSVYGNYIYIRMISFHFYLNILQYFEKLLITYKKYILHLPIANNSLDLVFKVEWNLPHKVFIRRGKNGVS